MILFLPHARGAGVPGVDATHVQLLDPARKLINRSSIKSKTSQTQNKLMSANGHLAFSLTLIRYIIIY